MNPMEVLDIRQLIGKTTEYDKKLALEVKKPKSWCKSVSAFANGIGGKLVWGIADDDTMIGLVDAKGDAEKISEAIKAHLDPIPDFNLSFAKCEVCDIKCNAGRSNTLLLYWRWADASICACGK